MTVQKTGGTGVKCIGGLAHWGEVSRVVTGRNLLHLLLVGGILGACTHEASDPEVISRDCLAFALPEGGEETEGGPNPIRPYRGNPCYWEYKGDPVLLLGASDEDNLFNHPDVWPFGLESHLDLMKRFGGNYVRNTMSSRDPGNVWPFAREEGGLYDLDSWNDEYWERFRTFLDLTYERGIIVQVEVWDRFDYARDPWADNPFNPRNNWNYTSESSGLPEVIRSHPGARENPFFRTIPELEDNPVVRRYQEAFVDRLLSITFEYPHVLYTISNETNESPLWSEYWARSIKAQAESRGVEVNVTEMWDAWDLAHAMHRATFDRPDLYSFADISQNNHQSGQVHWDNAQKALSRSLGNPPRPVNSVKIYGGISHGGSLEEGARRLWRNTFGGLASSRFHRTLNPAQPSGAGLSRLAQIHLSSLRTFTDSLDIFRMQPRLDLLYDRGNDEAYAMAEEGLQYAVYFPFGGSVYLDLSGSPGPFRARWLDILSGTWGASIMLEGGGPVSISPPGGGPWAFLAVAEGAR